MLYWLHEELEEGIRAQERHTVEALGVLLRRAAEGKHLLLCGRRVLTALEDWGKQAQLDFRSRGALEELGKRLKDAPPLLNAATVRVDVGPARWPRGWADHAKSVYQLPVTALDDMDAAAATTLLTEGQADAKLFEQAARALLAHKDYSCPRYIQLCIRLGLGGGGQIGDELVRISSHGAPVLCVVDADVSAPGEAPREGQTAWKALAAYVKLTCPAHVEVLAAREVENLLPLPLLLAAFSPVDRMLGAQWEGR